MTQAVIALEQDYHKPELGAGKLKKVQARTRTAAQAARVSEEIWLLGLPPLGRYLEFVEGDVVDGADADRAALIDEWRVANDYYQELERSEAGIANHVERTELDPGLT